MSLLSARVWQIGWSRGRAVAAKGAAGHPVSDFTVSLIAAFAYALNRM